MPTTLYTVVLDGSNDFNNPEGELYSWSNGYIQHARFELGDGNDLDATFELSGSDWALEYFHTWSAAGGILQISDVTNESGRFIRHMTLQEDSVVSLDTTNVNIIDGSSDASSHDVTLGAAGAQVVNLWSDLNKITTGSGFVDTIQTGGVDEVRVYGGAGIVNTGDQNDRAGLFGDFTGYVEMGFGDDEFWTVGGDAGRVFLGDGADTANLLNGFVDSLIMASGNDTVIANGGGAGEVRLDGGNDVVEVKGGSQLRNVEAGSGNVSVTVEAGSRINSLNVRDGTHIVEAQADGRIREISGENSALTLSTGTEFTSDIKFWRSDTSIEIGSGGAGWVDLFSDQSQTHSVISSGFVDNIVMGDGQTMDLVLSNEGAGRVSLGDLADKVVVQNGAGVDFIDTREGNDSVQVLAGGYVETLIVGQGSDNVLIDSSNANSIRLGTGTDTLTVTGGGFVQIIDGFTGNKTIDIRDGFADYITLVNGNDTVFGGNGSENIRAGSGNDVLNGGGGNDVLEGEDGNDEIRGGSGTDEATGGSGADRFVFFVGDGILNITDFEAGVDDLALGNVGAGFTIQDLIPLVSQDGNDVVIGSGSQEIRFEDTQLSDLSAGDVVFV